MTKKLNIPFSPPDITEEEIQKLTDSNIAEIDKLVEAKSKEIMSI